MAKKKTDAAPAAAETATPWALDTTKPQFFASGQPVAKVTVQFWSYLQFQKALRQARIDFAAADSGESWPTFWQRARILGQARAWDTAGKPMAINATDLMLMPIRQGVALAMQVDRGVIGTAGDVVRGKDGKPTGDGIDEPILFRLATPLRATLRQNNESTDVEIAEIEFAANVFGDVEAIVASEGTPDAMPALMNIARGLIKQTPGKPSPEAELPLTPAMLEGLTFPDGDAIMRLVMPAFLEPVSAG